MILDVSRILLYPAPAYNSTYIRFFHFLFMPVEKSLA